MKVRVKVTLGFRLEVRAVIVVRSTSGIDKGSWQGPDGDQHNIQTLFKSGLG